MVIAFPDGVAERIEALAQQNGYPSAAEYLMSLVHDAEEDAAALRETSCLRPKNQAELDSMHDAGMMSGPPVRATPEFWEERQKTLDERMAKRPDDAS